jgi:hypothetical protein
MTVARGYDLLYIVTRHGCLHIFDIHTSHLLYSKKLISESVFVTTMHQDGGLICIARRCGNLIKISVDFERLLEDHRVRHGDPPEYLTQV